MRFADIVSKRAIESLQTSVSGRSKRMKELFVASLLVVVLIAQILLIVILGQGTSLPVVIAAEIATALIIRLLLRRAYNAPFE